MWAQKSFEHSAIFFFGDECHITLFTDMPLNDVWILSYLLFLLNSQPLEECKGTMLDCWLINVYDYPRLLLQIKDTIFYSGTLVM